MVRTIQGMVAQLQEGWRTEARTEMMRRVEEENAEKWKGSVCSMWQATEQIWEINEHGRRRPRYEMQKEREQEASRQANVQDGAPAASHRRAPRQTEREGAGLRGITRSKSRRRQDRDQKQGGWTIARAIIAYRMRECRRQGLDWENRDESGAMRQLHRGRNTHRREAY